MLLHDKLSPHVATVSNNFIIYLYPTFDPARSSRLFASTSSCSCAVSKMSQTGILRDEVLGNASNIVDVLSQGHDPCVPEKARVEALRAAKLLVRALEKPEDGMLNFAYVVSRETCQ
jgi:hypothetical protein